MATSEQIAAAFQAQSYIPSARSESQNAAISVVSPSYSYTSPSASAFVNPSNPGVQPIIYTDSSGQLTGVGAPDKIVISNPNFVIPEVPKGAALPAGAVYGGSEQVLYSQLSDDQRKDLVLPRGRSEDFIVGSRDVYNVPYPSQIPGSASAKPSYAFGQNYDQGFGLTTPIQALNKEKGWLNIAEEGNLRSFISQTTSPAWMGKGTSLVGPSTADIFGSVGFKYQGVFAPSTQLQGTSYPDRLLAAPAGFSIAYKGRAASALPAGVSAAGSKFDPNPNGVLSPSGVSWSDKGYMMSDFADKGIAGVYFRDQQVIRNAEIEAKWGKLGSIAVGLNSVHPVQIAGNFALAAGAAVGLSYLGPGAALWITRAGLATGVFGSGKEILTSANPWRAVGSEAAVWGAFAVGGAAGGLAVAEARGGSWIGNALRDYWKWDLNVIDAKFKVRVDPMQDWMESPTSNARLGSESRLPYGLDYNPDLTKAWLEVKPSFASGSGYYWGRSAVVRDENGVLQFAGGEIKYAKQPNLLGERTNQEGLSVMQNQAPAKEWDGIIRQIRRESLQPEELPAGNYYATVTHNVERTFFENVVTGESGWKEYKYGLPEVITIDPYKPLTSQLDKTAPGYTYTAMGQNSLAAYQSPRNGWTSQILNPSYFPEAGSGDLMGVTLRPNPPFIAADAAPYYAWRTTGLVKYGRGLARPLIPYGVSSLRTGLESFFPEAPYPYKAAKMPSQFGYYERDLLGGIKGRASYYNVWSGGIGQPLPVTFRERGLLRAARARPLNFKSDIFKGKEVGFGVYEGPGLQSILPGFGAYPKREGSLVLRDVTGYSPREGVSKISRDLVPKGLRRAGKLLGVSSFELSQEYPIRTRDRPETRASRLALDWVISDYHPIDLLVSSYAAVRDVNRKQLNYVVQQEDSGRAASAVRASSRLRDDSGRAYGGLSIRVPEATALSGGRSRFMSGMDEGKSVNALKAESRPITAFKLETGLFTGLSGKSELNTAQNYYQKLNQDVRQFQEQIIPPQQKTYTRQFEDQLRVQDNLQRLRLDLNTKQQYEWPGFDWKPGPKIPPPEIPIILFPGGGDGPKGGWNKGAAGILRGNRGYQYAPSLNALVYNVRAKRAPKGQLSGLGLRPIVG
jgi:hypothetical protein